jgi:hypothetical protein
MYSYRSFLLQCSPYWNKLLFPYPTQLSIESNDKKPMKVLFSECIFFVGLELRTYTLSHSTSPFFSLEIGPHKLFAWAGFKLILLISASWIASIIGMSHWLTIFEMGASHYVAQASLELLGSRDTHTSVSWVAGTTDMYHHSWLK